MSEQEPLTPLATNDPIPGSAPLSSAGAEITNASLCPQKESEARRLREQRLLIQERIRAQRDRLLRIHRRRHQHIASHVVRYPRDHAESKRSEPELGSRVAAAAAVAFMPSKPSDKQLRCFFLEFRRRCSEFDPVFILQHFGLEELQHPRSVAADIVNHLQTAAFEAVGFDGRKGVLFVFDGLGRRCTAPALLKLRDLHFLLLSKMMGVMESAVQLFATICDKVQQQLRLNRLCRVVKRRKFVLAELMRHLENKNPEEAKAHLLQVLAECQQELSNVQNALTESQLLAFDRLNLLRDLYD